MAKKGIRRRRLEWYSVKTLFRTHAKGRPLGWDQSYDSGVTLIEERILIYRAASFKDAIRKAEVNAREYATSTRSRNPYGQKIVCRYLRACDAFKLFDEPETEKEVYSMTELVPRDLTDQAIVDRFLGTEGDVDPRRRNIFNESYSGRAWPSPAPAPSKSSRR